MSLPAQVHDAAPDPVLIDVGELPVIRGTVHASGAAGLPANLLCKLRAPETQAPNLVQLKRSYI